MAREVTEYATWEEWRVVKDAQAAKGYEEVHDDYDETVVGKGWLTHETDPASLSREVFLPNPRIAQYAALDNADDRIAYLASRLGLTR